MRTRRITIRERQGSYKQAGENLELEPEQAFKAFFKEECGRFYLDERDRDLALLVVFAVGFFSLLVMAYYASSPLTILLGMTAVAALGFGVVYQVWRIRRKNQ